MMLGATGPTRHLESSDRVSWGMDSSRPMSLDTISRDLRKLTDEVLRLNQAVAELSRQDRAYMPWGVRVAIIIPSVAVTTVCTLWIAMQAGAALKSF